MSEKLKGLTQLLKSLLLLLLTVVSALMVLSGYGILPKGRDAGILLILTIVCSSLIPFKPLPGKSIFDYKKAVSIAILVPLLVLIMAYELQLLPLWTYGIAGIVAVLFVPMVLKRLTKQRAIDVLPPPPPPLPLPPPP